MPFLDTIAERAVDRLFRSLTDGALLVRDGAHVRRYGDATSAPVEMTVHDRRFFGALAFGGSLGASEAYMDGWWSSPDLTGIVRLIARHRDLLEGMESGANWIAGPLRRLAHRLNRNSRAGSRRNIAAHYDLSNEFFALMLDDTMAYSCGVFERPDATLRDASLAKFNRMIAMLDVRADHHVLEIGTGWGGFAMHLAREIGCRITTTTISHEQFVLATERIAAAGLSDRITVLLQDYRDLTGQYDRLVSIEMIEAVGHEYYGAFFAQCAALLTPQGRMALQSITVEDRRYESQRTTIDFIKKHIFPGSNIPSVAVLLGASADTDLRLVRADEIGLHYADTLRAWRLKFTANADKVRALGFDERFMRMWEYYLCYTEGGFLESAIGDVQMAFAKPAAIAGAARR
ncbi:MAG: cyclopropane-fatty-acyl-phospholipid synthase [Gemmatimonadetes bacterium]|nr:cyclopropane-fatty-acyl-phospholipid synthase [Gemmatimonadota bacterium]